MALILRTKTLLLIIAVLIATFWISTKTIIILLLLFTLIAIEILCENYSFKKWLKIRNKTRRAISRQLDSE